MSMVLDVDGTIAGEDNFLSPSVQTAIAQVQAKGIKVAIATGRMYCSALRFHALIASDQPLIAYNGAWVQHPVTQDVLQHSPLSVPLATALLEHWEQPEWVSRLDIHCYYNDELYVREITPRTIHYTQRSGISVNPVGDLRPLLEQEVTKMLALSDDTLAIAQLYQQLKQQYTTEQLYITQSTPTFVEATRSQVNKGTAVQFLTEDYLNYQPQQVMAIGDNWNDLEMLQYAGFPVIMGNAPHSLKQFAAQHFSHWVAPDVEADGVAKAIEKFLL
ncbi:Cof-type HAD-IIB family hydrolase [Spirulina sp. CS-785/01]|uniref:Cof-type HAD-IIB family hydrolase n=1 Tax=Spirulina sp. CS-785/01 TaxID=3021716 RepID=UPI0023300FF9|nr:Cof-type HAD-IIB family hydrolase [Spirulina sp. CS-785/01]MDB9311741.1 Cof-type HAD-IIB family hydrolase [Spirulina sp. CS-785/01]